MPVLWSDPNPGGIYPSQAPFFSPQAVDPRLAIAIGQQKAEQQNQIANLGQQVIQGLHENMQQRQRDRIANTLLAAQSTGQPVSPEQLKTASDVGTFGFGGAPVQDLGGAQTYNAYNQALDAASKRQSAQLQNVLTGAHALHYLSGGGDSGAPSGKVWDDRLGGYVTPYQRYEATQKIQKASLDPGVEKARKEMGTFGFTPEDLPNIPEFHPVDVPGKRKGETDRAYRIATADGRTALIPEEMMNRWTNLTVAGKFKPQTAATSGAASGGNIPRLSSPEQAQGLPSGQLFYDDKGTLRRVP